MSCRQKRDSAVWHTFGAGILVCAFGGQLCFIQSNLWSNLWLRSLCDSPQITEFTVMGYPPLLLSGKVSTSYLLPLLALRLLTPQSVCLSSCIRQVQQGHRLQVVSFFNATVIAAPWSYLCIHLKQAVPHFCMHTKCATNNLADVWTISSWESTM